MDQTSDEVRNFFFTPGAMFWDSRQESDCSAIFTNMVTWNKMSSKFPMCMRLASLSQWMNLKKGGGLDIKWRNSHPNTPVFPVSLASSVGDLGRDHEDYFLTPLEHWSVPDLSRSRQASSPVHLGDLTHISSTETARTEFRRHSSAQQPCRGPAAGFQQLYLLHPGHTLSLPMTVIFFCTPNPLSLCPVCRMRMMQTPTVEVHVLRRPAPLNEWSLSPTLMNTHIAIFILLFSDSFFYRG